jgi:hypothetical protein
MLDTQSRPLRPPNSCQKGQQHGDLLIRELIETPDVPSSGARCLRGSDSERLRVREPMKQSRN